VEQKAVTKLKTMGMIPKGAEYKKAFKPDEDHKNDSAHPCLRHIRDSNIVVLLNALPEEGELYDMGAKYYKYRAKINMIRPKLHYHGVRSTIGSLDAAYCATHKPHPDDIVAPQTYDWLYDVVHT